MARHAGGAPGFAIAQWAGKAPKKRTSSGIGEAAFVKLLREVENMLASGSFGDATGRHFVALYADLHYRIYGVQAVDLGAKQRLYAAKMAGDLLRKEFGGDAAAMSRFVAWTWTREKERERWRRENGRAGNRIDWRLQFGPRLLVDWRLDEKRAAARS